MRQIEKDRPDFIFYTWIFVAGSVLGSVWEILWYFVRYLSYSTRTALVLGLWNVLYGMGLVILTLVLVPVRHKNGAVIFLVALIAGSAVEYIASVGQEIVFGSTSWDYSNMPFNLFGRINLLYSVVWGLAGYLWMKYAFPALKRMNAELPRVGAYVLIVFLIINIVVSVAATFRWKARLEGAGEATTALESLLDFFFNDDAMEFCYPNWHFGPSGT